MAAGGPGDGPVTEASPTSTPSTDSGRVPLNIALWVAVVLAAVATIFLGKVIWDQHERAAAPSVDAGQQVGSGVVEAMSESSSADQERIADVLNQGTKFINAFLNVDYRKIDSDIEAVRSMGTPAFQKQYDRSVPSMKKLAERLKSVASSEVVWAAYESGDADSATVLLATQGTATNTLTHGKPTARYVRIRLDLSKVGDRWLANNVVQVGAGS